MKLAITIFYFIIAIILFASIGVWLPYCFEAIKDGKHLKESLTQNIVTYFIAILVSASIDYILVLIDKDNLRSRKLLILIVALANVIIFLMTAYILYQNSIGQSEKAFGWAIFGVLLSYIMWWIANFDNSNFNPTSALGGDVSNTLSNG